MSHNCSNNRLPDFFQKLNAEEKEWLLAAREDGHHFDSEEEFRQVKHDHDTGNSDSDTATCGSGEEDEEATQEVCTGDGYDYGEEEDELPYRAPEFKTPYYRKSSGAVYTKEAPVEDQERDARRFVKAQRTGGYHRVEELRDSPSSQATAYRGRSSYVRNGYRPYENRQYQPPRRTDYPRWEPYRKY